MKAPPVCSHSNVRSRENYPVPIGGRFWPRLCENSFRSPRRIANRRIRYDESPEIASTWLKLTHENGARAFSHSLGRLLPSAVSCPPSHGQPLYRCSRRGTRSKQRHKRAPDLNLRRVSRASGIAEASETRSAASCTGNTCSLWRRSKPCHQRSDG
jgi:hypothetical protein